MILDRIIYNYTLRHVKFITLYLYLEQELHSEEIFRNAFVLLGDIFWRWKLKVSLQEFANDISYRLITFWLPLKTVITKPFSPETCYQQTQKHIFFIVTYKRGALLIASLALFNASFRRLREQNQKLKLI